MPLACAYFWADPWDLLAAGVDAALDRMISELGATALCVRAASGPLGSIRCGIDAPDPCFLTEGGLHFIPAAERYAATRVRPAPADWIKSRDPLETIAAAARVRGVSLRVRLSLGEAPALVARDPTLACRDAFGRRSDARLCPANPDVREYAAAIVADLCARHGLAAIELDGVGFGTGAMPGRIDACGIALGPIERTLLGLCFCESCMRASSERGVDPQPIMRTVQAELRDRLSKSAGDELTWGDLLARDAMLASYVAGRSEPACGQVAAARRRATAPLLVHFADDLAAETTGDVLADSCDGLILPPTGETAHRTRRGERPWSAVGFNIAAHAWSREEALVIAVHEAAELGIDAIGFEQFGVAPPASLDAVRRALRYAKRER